MISVSKGDAAEIEPLHQFADLIFSCGSRFFGCGAHVMWAVWIGGDELWDVEAMKKD